MATDGRVAITLQSLGESPLADDMKLFLPVSQKETFHL